MLCCFRRFSLVRYASDHAEEAHLKGWQKYYNTYTIIGRRNVSTGIPLPLFLMLVMCVRVTELSAHGVRFSFSVADCLLYLCDVGRPWTLLEVQAEQKNDWPSG